MGNANRDEGKTPPRPRAIFYPNFLMQSLLAPKPSPPLQRTKPDSGSVTPIKSTPVIPDFFGHKRVRHSRFEKPAFHLNPQR